MHKTYTINGMTCEHCVKAITEEVSALTASTTSLSPSNQAQ